MGKIALMFAGQGAQYSGMGSDLYENSAAAREVFDMGERIMPGVLKRCFEGSGDELSVTKNTQPTLFLVDLACAAALAAGGVNAQGAAGFSLGEMPALAFCGILPYENAFELVLKRAEFMHECAEKNRGSMAAVLRLSEEQVEKLCDECGVYPVNYNCPGQIVAAGSEEGIEKLCHIAAENGGRTVKLAVSGAFHSPFMEEASAKMAEYLKGINLTAPAIPLYANKTAKPYSGDMAELIAGQVKSSVKWQNTVQNMISDGFDTFIEVGAGKTLSGLVKKISKNVRVLNVENMESLNAVLNEIKGE